MKRFGRWVGVGAVGIGVLAAFACGSSSGESASPKGNDGGGPDGSQSGDAEIFPGDGGNVVTPGFSKVGTGEYETLYLVDGVIYGYGGGCGLLGQGKYSAACI